MGYSEYEQLSLSEYSHNFFPSLNTAQSEVLKNQSTAGVALHLCTLTPDCIYEEAVKIKALLFQTHAYSRCLPGSYEYFTLFEKAQFSFKHSGYG